MASANSSIQTARICLRRVPGLSALLPLLAAMALLAGCQSLKKPREFAAPGEHWATAQGQLQYRTQKPPRSLIGEVVLSGHGARQFQLDYLAGPGVPLMRLRAAGDSAQIEGLFAGGMGRWQGNPARAGARQASWLALGEVFATLERRAAEPRVQTATAPSSTALNAAGGLEIASPAGAKTPWKARQTAAPGQPRRVAVEFPKTGERFTFVLAQ